MEEKFKKGDYIINRSGRQYAIYDKVDAKNYIHFKKYYCNVFNRLKDPKKYTLQLNYQKFWDKCTEEEAQFLDQQK